MKQSKISTEDPRLTAYALGELEPTEAARVEESIRNDPAALETVKEIRAIASELERALENEPVVPRISSVNALKSRASRGEVIRFPSVWIATAAAASVAAVLAIRTVSQHRQNSSSQDSLEAAASAANPPAGLDPAAVAESARRRSVRDGFSDVKPATFREDGLKLGKSVAAAEKADGSSTDGSADVVKALSDVDPVRFDSSDKAIAALNEPQNGMAPLSFNGDLPVLEISRAGQVPMIQVNPDFSFASKDFKFSSSPVGSGVLKVAPRNSGTTYEQVLTWSHDASEKQGKSPRRDDVIDPSRKTKNPATGAVVE